MNSPYPFYSLPQIKSLKQMVESQFEEDPQRIAFRFRNGQEIVKRTISDFHTDIYALGTWLFDRKIHNTHIALIAPNSYLWLIVYFSVINSGNLIVPIDKDLPPEEQKCLIEHSDSQYLFTDDKIAELLKALPLDAKLIRMSEVEGFLTEGKKLIKNGFNDFDIFQPDVNCPATIVYTSGTTGKSKGVVLSQRNIVSNVNMCCKSFNPMGDALSVLPFHHMFGLVPALIMFINYRSSIFLCSGLKYFMKDLLEFGPSTIMVVPLFIESLYKQIVKEKTHNAQAMLGNNLRYILVGGAALDPFYEEEFRSWGINLIPAYGATECSPGIAVNRNHYHKVGSVGLPVDGCNVRIAKDGEILIRGDNVFSGYYHDPQATQEALIDGWYHSGDLGYLDADGFLYITGRKKNLIILDNGENISPESFESQLFEIEGVEEVLVYEKDHAIIAEIYANEQYKDNMPYFTDAVDHINRSLIPSFRIRKVILRGTRFPRNHSGKILRNV